MLQGLFLSFFAATLERAQNPIQKRQYQGTVHLTALYDISIFNVDFTTFEAKRHIYIVFPPATPPARGGSFRPCGEFDSRRVLLPRSLARLPVAVEGSRCAARQPPTIYNIRPTISATYKNQRPDRKTLRCIMEPKQKNDHNSWQAVHTWRTNMILRSS